MHYTKPKIEELESIRGIAAIIIVFFHLPKWNPILDNTIINNGYLMVDFFFTLSGFVIYQAYAENIKTKEDLLRFQFLRFCRLYPLHFLFLIIFLIFEIIKYFLSSKLDINALHSTAFETNNFKTFLKNFFLIASILPNQPESYNYPAWSISVEFYTYLIFAIIILIFKRNCLKIFSAVAFASFFMLATKNTFGFDTLLRCFTGFFIGCLTARLTNFLPLKIPSFYSLLFFSVTVIYLSIKSKNNHDFLIYIFSATFIASIALSNNGIINKILTYKIFKWLGSISYSIYMSHASLEWITVQVLRFILKKPDQITTDGRLVSHLSTLETLVTIAILIMLLLLISSFIYNNIEKPIREKSRNFLL